MKATLTIPVSPGELADKLTILEIKQERVADPARRASAIHEYRLLHKIWRAADVETSEIARLKDQLRAVNERLWRIEDEIRAHEARAEFDERFIELARDVYRHNDWRSELKNKINELLGSELAEVKQYTVYPTADGG